MCSLRRPPGWMVSISVWHSEVAMSSAALMRSMPSSTVMAWVGAGAMALTVMNGSNDSVSSMDRRRRSWISRSMGWRRWARATEGGTGRSQFGVVGIGS